MLGNLNQYRLTLASLFIWTAIQVLLRTLTVPRWVLGSDTQSGTE